MGTADNDARALMVQGDSCAAPTGDLFLSHKWQGSANMLHADAASIGGMRNGEKQHAFAQDIAPHDVWHTGDRALSPGALNFTTDHIVWKRMDGGNLTLPSPNARGLGAVPKTVRYSASNFNDVARTHDKIPIPTGETIYGNCRFSIETTNSAMMPVIQAQELAHPSLAEKYPHEIGDVLSIPNEETQFEQLSVIDDTGQKHILEGGSPFGTIIRDFSPITNRGIGSSPSSVGVTPNMEIQLPDPNTIPGNIIVRSGFDKVQSYQHETIGTGGMHMPKLNEGYDNFNTPTIDGGHADISGVFNPTLRKHQKTLYPYWENYGYEHISIENSVVSNTSVLNIPDPSFPFSSEHDFKALTDNNPLKTSYELHDRTLYFHIVKNGASYSKMESVYQGDYSPDSDFGKFINEVGALPPDIWMMKDPVVHIESLFVSSTSNTIVISEGMKALWIDPDNCTRDGTARWYFICTDESGNQHGGSYTGVSDTSGRATKFDTLTGVVFDADWPNTFSPGTIHRSWYTPAGSTRLFASRRMRDHAEVSGQSPDMPLIDWWELNSGGSDNPHTLIKTPRMTKMPIPRMGHHFITPTMAMMPGHLTHPLYQNIFAEHLACSNATPSLDSQSMNHLARAINKHMEDK